MHSFGYFKRNNSIILKWLISYAFILVIPILISSIAFFQTNKILKGEINKASQALTNQIGQSIDKQLEEIEKFINIIVWDDRVNSLSRKTSSIYSDYLFDTYKIAQQLNSYQSSFSIPDDFYIYFANERLGVFANKIAEVDYLYAWVHSSTGLDYDQWQALITSKHSFTAIPLKRKDTFSETHDSIAFITSLPVPQNEVPLANFLLFVDKSKFIESVRAQQWYNEGKLLIYNNQNNLLVSSDFDPQGLSVDISNFTKKSGVFSTTIDGREYAVSYLSSSRFGWKYVSIIPQKQFLEKFERVRNITVLSLLLSLLIGGIATGFILKYNYSPISSLMKFITQILGTSKPADKNEYRIIHDTIAATFSEVEKANRQLLKQKVLVKSNFIQKLLKGRIDNNITLEESLQYFGMEFESDFFGILLFYFEDFSKFIENGKGKDFDEDYKLLQFILTNVAEELCNQNNHGYMSEIDDTMVCIVNFKNENTQENEAELRRIAIETTSFLKDKFDIYLNVSASNIIRTIGSWPDAYKNAQETNEYRLIKGNAPVMLYSDLPMRQKSASNLTYHYPLLMEQQLINSIKTGDLTKAKETLDIVFETNLKDDLLTVQTAKSFMIEIVGSITKAANDLGEMLETDYNSHLYNILTSIHSKSLSDIQQDIFHIICEICEQIKQKLSSGKTLHRDRQNKEFIDKIVSYININYNNYTLNLNMVSDKFDVSSPYLSKLFKQYTGESMLDYINLFRIKKTKELMSNSAININDISKNVGFCDVNSFIRTFKKYEGITPGKYKEISNYALSRKNTENTINL